ncbi:helix-turn-helix domain-containing protein [Changchengzhania lutea]|uniref:helix-turn-helix domain-containing protein n=1 Tax=Changchengzhania lutea TaxID=2049305 RepID=UPI00115EE99D|nr:helix-turn-helix transcriptional regulator [Changchengzhania lutea]
MNLDNNLLFFFSALGAFNSLVLSIYFLVFKKAKLSSNYFLGALLAVLSIRVWKSIFFYFNPNLSKIYLQIGLSACIFIGPFLYFFLRTKLSNSKKHTKYFIFQLVILLLLVLLVGILYPYETNPDLWGTVFYKVINYQWLLYIIASITLIKPVFKKSIRSKTSLNYDEIFAISVFIGVLIIWLSYFFASYTSYIMGAITFSFSIYLSILVIYFKRKTSNKKEKYADNKINANDASELLLKIDQAIQEQELYKNPNLTLTKLAKDLNIRSHLISQLLNDNLNKNFSLYINEYRIKEAKRILKLEPNLKIEVIAEMCGFNSNSTFYTAFKKITNTTPSKYLSST